MGVDMASIDAPNGFEVWGECLRQTMYAVTAAPTIHVYHGDMVVHGSASLVTKFGTMTIIEDGAVPDGTAATQKILGVVTAIFDEKMDPVKYIAATEAGDSTVAGYVMVADHPDQHFVIQEDGSTNAIDLVDVGLTADVQSAALCAGTTATGRSTQEIDSSSVAGDAAHDLKILYPHPDDSAGDDTTCYTRWIVQINTQFYDAFHVGA